MAPALKNFYRYFEARNLRYIDWNAWKRPEIFNLIQSLGNVPEDDMRHSMNLGIGLILIIKPEGLSEIQSHLEFIGETYIELGRVC